MINTQPSSYRLGYRSDIEGLRAVAILLVVAAHADIPWLAGGFVGVDVFFVLSGYLITGLLMQEIHTTADLRFAAFYARRLRRLMPALLFMLLCVSLMGWLLLIPMAQIDQAKAAGGAALWMSNFYFALSNLNYFSPDAKTNLFLHTWSLGVEEQFYLVWPLLMVLVAGVWKGARRAPQLDRLKPAMSVLFVLSLSLCLWWSWQSPHLAFYMMPSRAWQFALGALVFIYFGTHRTRQSEKYKWWPGNGFLIGVAGWTGLALIVLAALVLNDNTTYPGGWALLPSLGAAMVIVAGTKSSNLGVGRLLSARYMQGIGQISYSWYLWHWPVLLLGAAVIDMHSGLHRLGLVILSFLIAVFSYRYVEMPVRRMKHLIARPRIAVTAGVSIMMLAGLLTIRWDDSSIELMKSPGQVRYLQAEWDAPIIYNMGCDDWYLSSQVKICAFGADTAPHTVVLMGDSVGVQWFPAVREVFNKPDWRLLLITKSSCPMVDEPLFYPRIGRIYSVCTQWRARALRELAAMKPDILIFGSTYIYNYTKDQWSAGTRRVLSEISPSVKHVYILRSTPTIPFDGPACLAPRSWLYRMLTGKNHCMAPAHNRKFDDVYSWLESAASHYPNVSMVDMTDAVCPDDKCRAQRDGIIVFRDTEHMTASFARSLGAQLSTHLQDSMRGEATVQGLSSRE